MSVKHITRGLVAMVLLMFILESCATTKFKGSWMDETIPSEDLVFDKILVLGLSIEPSVRRTFEFSLRQELINHGVDAISTLEVVGHNQEISRDTFEALFGDRDIDAVIVSRLVGVETDYRYETNYVYAVPHSYYNGFWGYYNTSYGNVYSQGYLTSEEWVIIETNLYETKTGKLVWSGTSETAEQSTAMDVIESLNKALIKELASKGLI